MHVCGLLASTHKTRRTDVEPFHVEGRVAEDDVPRQGGAAPVEEVRDIKVALQRAAAPAHVVPGLDVQPVVGALGGGGLSLSSGNATQCLTDWHLGLRFFVEHSLSWNHSQGYLREYQT